MRRFQAFTIMLVLFVWTGATADPDPKTVRMAVDSGSIVGLDRVLEQASTQFPGRILGVELEDEGDAPSGWIYEVKILKDDNSVIEVEYDAGTLKVLEIEGDDWRERRRRSR